MSDREWDRFNDANREGISNLGNSYDTFALPSITEGGRLTYMGLAGRLKELDPFN